MTIRYRRNINCLTSDQLHDLREAFQGIYDMPEAGGDSFATIGGIHGLPNPSWCDHGVPGFFTWHRAYMRAFEKALQCVKSDVMLPFWDWSSGPSTGVPAACRESTYVNRDGDTVSNPLYSGPVSAAAGGGVTARSATIDTRSFAGPATSAQAAMSSLTFSSFQGAINGPHGTVHVYVGGQMGSTLRAGFDPIFYLHHANVDRLWWNWQQTHPGLTIPSSEATYALDPFNKPFSTDWYDGADMESTDDLGYRYSNWCLWIPPLWVWDLVAVKIDPWMIKQLRNARLVLRSSRMPANSVEFRAFINQPEESQRTAVEDNASFAGTVAAFGMGDMEMEVRSASASFDLEMNITEKVRASFEDNPEELKLLIVALDAEGEPVDPDQVELDDIELIFE